MRNLRKSLALAVWLSLPGIAAAASVSGANIPALSQITDLQSNVWTVTSGVIAENGAPAGYSANVTMLLLFNGVIYQTNAAGGWWSWSGGTWVNNTDPRVVSGNFASIPPGAQIVDGSRNVWTTAAGVVYENGINVGAGANLAMLRLWNGVIYYKNTALRWFSWSGGAWVAVGGSQAAAFAIKVAGNHFVDGSGKTVQLRGVNVSGLEFVAIQGWDPGNPWGSQTGDATPNWQTIKSWGSNAVRLPLNEASWLGLSCTNYGDDDADENATIKADPGGNYQATVKQSVAAATAAGLYVILDLHWAAPNINGVPACPTTQNAMADADHSMAFWTSVANQFKSNPAVIFELFNEPFLGNVTLAAGSPWPVLLNGGGVTQFLFAGGAGTLNAAWSTAGMQMLLDTVRATGATNVVLTSTLAWSYQMDGWLLYKPTDSTGQLGAVWHPYPQSATQVGCEPDGIVTVGFPQCSPLEMAAVRSIVAAGYPVVATEYGDAVGGSGSPWAAILLPFADTNGVSYLGWTWNPWGGATSNVLISDAAGTPTVGYGAYVKQHYLCRAAGTAQCP